MRSSRFCSVWRVSLAFLIAAASCAAQSGGIASLVVVNGATFDQNTPLAPLMLASAFGDFGSVSEATASGVELPTTLGGVQVVVAGASAGLLYVSRQQINFVLPADTQTGKAEITVQSGGNQLGTTTVEVAHRSPVLFIQSAAAERPGLITNADGALNSQSSPATAGQQIWVYATGLGTDPTAEQIGAMVGLQRMDAGAVELPGLPGVWRIQFTAPSQQDFGSRMPLAIYMPGAASNTVSFWVE